MKKIATIALAAVLAVGVTTAIAQVSTGGLQQKPGQHKHHGHFLMHRMAQQLGLSDAQKSEMKAIREKTKASLKTLHSSTVSKDAKKAEFKQIRQNAREQMLAVLTPAQRQKLQAMRAKFRANHPGIGK
jgi:Spy/CpxP family protein refolding chaperone